MIRLTQANSEELQSAAEALAEYANDLANAIQEWIDAKEEGSSFEAREAAAVAREDIGFAIDSMEVALGDLGYEKVKS